MAALWKPCSVDQALFPLCLFKLYAVPLNKHSTKWNTSLFNIWHRASWIPRSLSNLMFDVAMKPLLPTSTGQTIAFQPRCSASNAMSAYTAAFSSQSLHQHYPPLVLSPCHLVPLSPCHLVTLSPCHLVTLSPCHLVTLHSAYFVDAVQGVGPEYQVLVTIFDVSGLLQLTPGFVFSLFLYIHVNYLTCIIT